MCKQLLSMYVPVYVLYRYLRRVPNKRFINRHSGSTKALQGYIILPLHILSPSGFFSTQGII